MIKVLTNQTIVNGMLPADVGCIVSNVASIIAIYEAVALNIPLIEKIVTVTGDAIFQPQNFKVRLGTKYQTLVDACGGFKVHPQKIISGGPMMGTALFNLDVPVSKTSSALVCLSEDEVSKTAPTACIHCGRCVDVCPIGLIPQLLYRYARTGDKENFLKVHGNDCMECGCCTFTCPAKRNMTQSFKKIKKAINDDRKKGATAIITAVLSEYLYQRLMKLPITIKDGSAAITGLLLALCLSSSLPLWMVALGSIFAVIIVKQLFGGLGQNFMNPALAARCFLLISFAGKMNSFVSIDASTSATPLAMIQNGQNVNLLKMFIGNTSGTIGETSVIALLLGAIYLIYRKVISPKIPLCILFSFSLIILINNNFNSLFLLQQICGGGLMIGAFFMATDYVTSPITPTGKIIYGLVIGILAAVFRLYGNTPEGMSFAIIITNLLVPLIEKVTVPKIKGSGGKF